MVRSFGTVAAVTAAALALIIGFFAFTTHPNQPNANRPPGSQAPVPATGHGLGGGQNTRYGGAAYPSYAGGYGNPPQTARGAQGGAGGEAEVYVAPSGGASVSAPAAFSSGTSASVAAAPTPCAGLVSSLLGLVSSLLGGSGC